MGWKKVEEVTDDGAVVRKVLSGPERVYQTPNAGAKVTIRYTARLADGTVFDQRGEGNELVYTTDEEQVRGWRGQGGGRGRAPAGRICG